MIMENFQSICGSEKIYDKNEEKQKVDFVKSLKFYY